MVLIDYLPDAPGHALADVSLVQDTLDIRRALTAAKEHAVDGIVTSGTDLPVTTMATVAEELGLPSWIGTEAAVTATDKPRMNAALAGAGVPVTRQQVLEAATDRPNLDCPVVVKPADSQGQRGVSLVVAETDLDRAVAHARTHSPTERIVVERWEQGPEVTANAWVEGDSVVLLAVNDRVTYNPPPAVGVAFQHVYPSRHAGDLELLGDIMVRVATAYEMTSGPLYVQMIMTASGPVVIEAAARVGGGHESSMFPWVCHSTVEDRLIDLALTGKCEPWPHDMRDGVPLDVAITFVMGRAGVVADSRPPVLMEGTVEHSWYVRPGTELGAVTNSMGRIGYFVTTAHSRSQLDERVARQYAALQVLDESGKNLVLTPEPEAINR